MPDYEQAYRDLRAGVEALTLQLSNRYARLCMQAQGEEEFADDDAVEADTLSRELNSLRALLASSAPATASEGATECGCSRRILASEGGHDFVSHNDCSAISGVATICTRCSQWSGKASATCPAAAATAGVKRATKPARNSEASEVATEHDFLPVNGHPDDDECTHRADGTDATYCGKTRAEHDEPEHHPNCYQSTGKIPADLPGDLCDCRVLRMIDTATGVTSPDGDRGLSDPPNVLLTKEERASVCPTCTALTGQVHDPERDMGCAWTDALVAAVERITAQVVGTERVEWGVRCSAGIYAAGLEFDARLDLASDKHHDDCVGERTLIRRTVTEYAPVVGPWEVVGDARSSHPAAPGENTAAAVLTEEDDRG